MPPVIVEVERGGVIESRHRGHIVEVRTDGRVERALGDPDTLVTLRSCQKPFALAALIESGAADELALTPPELALMAASHSGEDVHVRTLQAVFRRANVTSQLLACGTAGMPLDELTRVRLWRDGDVPGPLRHMCSGYHAASILLSRHAGWSLDGYFEREHASQKQVRDVIARAFAVPVEKLREVTDGCGLPTYAFPLVEVARGYAFLADPAGQAREASQSSLVPALTRVRDAMLAAPEMVGGTRDRIDTAVMKVTPGRLVAKGGAEALRGIGFLPGSTGNGSAPARQASGLAIKIDDGDFHDRAGRAALIEALSQIGVIDERQLRQLSRYHRPPLVDPLGEVVGHAVPRFELAPLGELV